MAWPEANILGHPRLAWFVFPTHNNLADAVDSFRTLLGILQDRVKSFFRHATLFEPGENLGETQMLDRCKHRHGVFHQLGVAKLADMENLLAHCLKHRLMLIK